MRCPTCSNDNPVEARFCGSCGSSLAAFTGCAACGEPNEQGIKFCRACGSPLTTLDRPESIGGGRYELRDFLGEGGRKRVYLAHDMTLDRDVAIALIKTEGLDEDGLERIRREAQSMARLGDHPNIVTVHDIGEEAGRHFIVSEYMAGGSVEDLLAKTEEHRVPLDRALRIGAEIADALAHAHDRGVIHRDLKPRNVWLSAGGLAKLGDFGLARALDSTRLTLEGMMVGTVAYMAPEMATGREVDQRADLYALGALLYEMTTGRPPFVGEDAANVISQHLTASPVAPSWHNPAVAGALEDVILSLLSKDPDARPAGAGTVAQALREAIGAPDPALPAPPRPGLLPPQRRTPFVGREAEMTALRTAIDGAAAGRGSLVMVAGEPGIGKTRLAEEAAVYARLQGFRTLAGRCYEAEASIPYIPFVEAIRSYVVEREPDALAHEMGDGAADVAKIVSDVRARIPGIVEPPAGDPDQERYRLLEAVSRFLVSATASAPILLTLDDLHWGDSASLSMLAHLSRRLEGSRLVVVGTYRDVELDRRHPLADMLGMLRRERRFERILVRGLTVDEVLSLLEASAGQALGSGGRALAAALERETEGNPFFIEEIMRHLIESGVLYRSEGRWRYDVSVEDMGIPEGVREVIGRRLSRLPEQCNEVLTDAAVLGRDFDFPTLVAMMESSEDEVLSAIEQALEHQLIVEVSSRSEPTYSFTHALVRQTLYDELSLPRKQRLHLRAAQAIERVREQHLGPHSAALATHYRLAGAATTPEKAIEFSIAAAGTAWQVAAWVEAIGHLEGALDILEQTNVHSELLPGLLENLGTLMYMSGVDLEAGARYLERSLALHTQANDRRRMAVCRTRLGFVRATFKPSMSIPEAFEHLAAAEELLSGAEPSPSLGYIQIGYATAHIYSGHPKKGIEAAQRAIQIGEAIGSDAIRINAEAVMGYFHMIDGNPHEGLAALDRAYQDCEIHNLAFVGFVVSWLRGSIGFWAWDPIDGLFWIERELAQPRTAQAPNLRRVLLNMRGHLLLWRGRPEEIGDLPEFVVSGYNLEPELDWWAGNFDSALARLDQSWALSTGQGDKFGAYGSSWWKAMVHHTLGNTDAALKALDAVLDEHGRIWTIRLNEALQRAQVLAAAGRVTEARVQCERGRELLVPYRGIGALEAGMAHADAVVSAAEGRIDDAGRHFATAVAEYTEVDSKIWRALVLADAGRALLAAGRREAAAAKLSETLEAMREAKAGRWWIDGLIADKMRALGLEGLDASSSIHALSALVVEDVPDLTAAAGKGGVVAILFSDIEGYTEMNQRLGDEVAQRILREHNRIVRDRIAAHSGTEVKTIGDAFMIAFSRPADAVACARAMREGLAALEEPVRVRIGIHAGPVIREDGDFFGTTVILAARLASAAHGGEILVSGQLRAHAGDAEERSLTLKGLSGERVALALR